MLNSETEQAVEKLLDAFWVPIAASGWNRYQLHGRGALMASVLMLEGKADSMDYMTANETQPLPEWLAAKIRSYDPETSVVLVFVEHDVFRRAGRPVKGDLREENVALLTGGAYFTVATRTPPPPQCAQMRAN